MCPLVAWSVITCSFLSLLFLQRLLWKYRWFPDFSFDFSACSGKLREVKFSLLFTVKVRLIHVERRLCFLNMALVAVVRKTGKTAQHAGHCHSYGDLQPSWPAFFLLLLGLPWLSHTSISDHEESVIWKTWMQCPGAGWLQGCLQGSCQRWACGCRVVEGVTWWLFLGGIMLLEPACFRWKRANGALRSCWVNMNYSNADEMYLVVTQPQCRCIVGLFLSLPFASL